jgi:transcriptional regulator with XRE-family HTH domain
VDQDKQTSCASLSSNATKATSQEGAPTVSTQLGQRIRALRATLSLTQEQLAQKAGISVSYLSMIECGDGTPHVETLVSLADALGISVSQLFLDANEPGGGQTHHLPLMAYLGSRRLSSGDVRALLAVAKAIFDRKS